MPVFFSVMIKRVSCMLKIFNKLLEQGNGRVNE